MSQLFADFVQELRLQASDGFVHKVVELCQLLSVRHSVFLLGPPRSGKSETRNVLASTNRKEGLPTTVHTVNPKVYFRMLHHCVANQFLGILFFQALSPDELYGTMDGLSNEWRDGLVGSILREMGEVCEFIAYYDN